MKKIVFTAMFLVATAMGFAQSPFDAYEDVKGVASIVMNQKMFKLLSKVDLNSSDPEMQAYINLVDNLDNVKMYTSAEAGLIAKMNKTMQSYRSSSNLQELMRANKDGKNASEFRDKRIYWGVPK